MKNVLEPSVFTLALGVLSVSMLACTPMVGPAGRDGIDGKPANVSVAPEPEGTNCARGGYRIDASVGNGPVTTAYVCHGQGDTGANGADARVDIADEPAGSNCAHGGKRLSTSVGDSTPVVSYVCHGAPGQSIVATTEPAGENCPAGGVAISDGSTTRYVCHGTNGANGQGATVTTLPAGDEHCPAGGAKVVSGSETAYVCSGNEVHVVVTPESAGANCANGGQKIAVSIGTAPATISYVCDGSTVSVSEASAGDGCANGGKRITIQGQSGDTSSIVCDGANGTNAVASAEAPGANCAHGGIKVTSAGATQYVCHGANGLDGSNGAKGDTGAKGDKGVDGQSVVASIEAPGPNCEYGGVKLASASGTNFVCNGAAGSLLSVNAGADQTVTVGSTVTLAGSAASSVIGLRWSQFSGPSITLSDSQSLTPTFVAPDFTSAAKRNVVLKLEATDGGRIESDLVVIKLNHVPAAPTVTITPAAPKDQDDLTCSYTGPATDADGDAVTYTLTWTKNGQAFTGATTVSSTSVVPNALTVDGDVFACTVAATDGMATTAGKTITRTVALAGWNWQVADDWPLTSMPQGAINIGGANGSRSITTVYGRTALLMNGDWNCFFLRHSLSRTDEAIAVEGELYVPDQLRVGALSLLSSYVSTNYYVGYTDRGVNTGLALYNPEFYSSVWSSGSSGWQTIRHWPANPATDGGTWIRARIELERLDQQDPALYRFSSVWRGIQTQEWEGRLSWGDYVEIGGGHRDSWQPGAIAWSNVKTFRGTR